MKVFDASLFRDMLFSETEFCNTTIKRWLKYSLTQETGVYGREHTLLFPSNFSTKLIPIERNFQLVLNVFFPTHHPTKCFCREIV